jgi:hypothetical protein
MCSKIVAVIALCSLAIVAFGRTQIMSGGPIRKENLISALESMQSRKSKRRDAAWYVAMVNEYKVSFRLTPDEEQQIRHAGRYLGRKGLDDLIAALRTSYRPIIAPRPSPNPIPDWKESDEAKKLAAQMLAEIQDLIDEGNLIDLTDYQKAMTLYLAWVEKSSIAVGRIDIQMRRFTKKGTNYKDDFDKATALGRQTNPKSKDYEYLDKELLRGEIKIALIHLNLTRKLVELDTMPEADVLRLPLPL